MSISGSATTNRTSPLEPRHVGSPAYRLWGTDRSDIWRWGADLSAPQPIAVGEPTGRFPRILPFGSRHVGSLDTAYNHTITKETYYKNADLEDFLSQEFVCNMWLKNIAVRLYRHNVRAFSRVRHQRDAISRPTRHLDCVDASFANGFATRT